MKPAFRVLVIDDEKIVCDRLSVELERAGLEVEALTESGQALERMSSQRFDLVITDIKMRGPNGIEVMNFVKENYPSTRVIVITGFATVETAREVLKGGAVDFIPKPFKISQLRELVLRLVAEKASVEPATDRQD
jgi:DNA-binding NtrC family response regulator